MVDNGDIEAKGITILSDVLTNVENPTFIQYKINSMDKEPITDGYINLYNKSNVNDNSYSKKNFLCRVDVQVKSTKKLKNKQNNIAIFNNLKRDDLEAISNLGGALLFVIDVIQRTIYFRILTKKSISAILNYYNKQNQKSTPIEVSELYKNQNNIYDQNEIYEMIRRANLNIKYTNYDLKDTNKKTKNNSTKKDESEENKNNSLNSIMAIPAVKGESIDDIIKRNQKEEIYTFKNENNNLIPDSFIIRGGIEKSSLIKANINFVGISKIYNSELIKKDNSLKIKTGENNLIYIEFDNSKTENTDLTITLKETTNLSKKLMNIDIAISILKNGFFYSNNNKIDLKININKSKKIKNFYNKMIKDKQLLLFVKDIEINTKLPFSSDNINSNDLKKLNKIIDLAFDYSNYLKNNNMESNSILKTREVINNKIYYLVFYKEKNDKFATVSDLLLNDKTIIKSASTILNPYIYKEKNDNLEDIYNFNLNKIIKWYDNNKIDEVQAQSINAFVLDLISVFDRIKDKRYINSAIYLINKIIRNNDLKDTAFINLMQSIIRKENRYPQLSDVLKLNKMTHQKNNPTLNFCAIVSLSYIVDVSLNNIDEYWNILKMNEKEVLKRMPIYTLYKNKKDC
ncbi:hypothetical protein GSH19_05135 [Lactobacillus sp. S2-2]|uniref:hypothetical protein n=1 Tax=Lactobacillus sp. S2-2 TaxID=2692917 RepID=UPI001F1B1D41|nr:hypothetical protein [Lactobacillus sp. S2-2]MCF6515536.1 hypothetical protein [Lactobacillus sp. S2-2]